MIDRTSTLRRFYFLKRCKVVILCPSRCPVPSSHDCLPTAKVKYKKQNKDKKLIKAGGGGITPRWSRSPRLVYRVPYRLNRLYRIEV